jgi:predicted phosphodiesterase
MPFRNTVPYFFNGRGQFTLFIIQAKETPVRLAVISDIHGNIEAFQQTLADIKNSDVDLIVNLGDSVGYGPEPEAVLSIIQNEGIVNILGNHEKAIIDKTYRRYSMAGARETIEHTLNFLTPGLISYIRNLPTIRVINDALFVHGCPPRSPTIYLNHLSISEIKNAFESYSQNISFAGHTHRLMLFSYNGKSVNLNPLTEKTVNLDPKLKFIINVGSVGQPRDGDPRAKYLIWDDQHNTLEIKRIDYDITATAAKIIERGFLKRDADRLF